MCTTKSLFTQWNTMHKIRVGVFMGGRGMEREVSFNSGRTICDHLDTTRYDVIPIFQAHCGTLFLLPWHFLHRGKITDFEHRLPTETTAITWDSLKSHVDFMYIATHGRYAEDGTLQGFLEILNIPYFGSKVFASALCMDKSIQKKILTQHAINVPKGITVATEQLYSLEHHIPTILAELNTHNISFPCVVKPHAEGSSLAVSIVFNENELPAALSTAASIHAGMMQPVIIEEKIEGMEFSCIILTDYVRKKPLPLPPTEIVPEPHSHVFDYEQKYMPGRARKFTPPRCTPEIISAIQQTCLRVMDVLHITNLARIDGFVTADNRIIIIDPNTLAGMGPTSFVFKQAAEIGMSHTHLINHLIETELHQYNLLNTIETKEKTDNHIMNTQKIRVAVLMGGDSNEREISLESGRNIVYKLSPQKYEAIPVFINQNMELFVLTQSLLVCNTTQEIADAVDRSMQVLWNDLPSIADFVFIGLHGGKGENGCVQGALEMLGLPYNGSATLTSALCMNKFNTNEFLRGQNINVPQSLLIDHQAWTNDTQKTVDHITVSMPFPLIVKPHDDGCSVMVQKATTKKELIDAINDIFTQKKEYALVEECIIGMELTVGVVGNETPRALPPSYTVSTADVLSITEKFLPGAGENQTPAPLAQQTLTQIQHVMETVYKAVGCSGYARIDCFYQTAAQSPTNEERVVVLEINTLPGMTPATCIFHQAAEIGLKPMDFVDLIIQFGFQKHLHRTPKDIHARTHSSDISNINQLVP